MSLPVILRQRTIENISCFKVQFNIIIMIAVKIKEIKNRQHFLMLCTHNYSEKLLVDEI